MSGNGFAPFVLGEIEDEPATQQPAPAPADPLAAADQWSVVIEALRAELPTAAAPPDDVVVLDRLDRAIKRYGRALADEEEGDRKTGNAANLAADLELHAQEMDRLSGLASQARRFLAKATGVPEEGNGAALDKAIRRGLTETQQPRHDDFHRILRRMRQRQRQRR